MTDERKAPCTRHCESTAFEIEIRQLKRQLAECQDRERGLVDKANGYVIENARLTEQLAECQSQVKAAKREALVEAADYAQQQSLDAKVAFGEYARGCENEAASIAIALRNMAKELE